MGPRVTALAALAVVGSAEIVIRNTTYGPVMGSDDGRLQTFHSIPFAAPPLGALRFRAPQPPTPWTEPLDVQNLPQPCVQLKIDGDIMVGGEDCLYLQVYVPDSAAANGPLPVMAWIFGGGYILGDSEEFGLYDATNLALSRGVIVVAMNYRLGPFGFMALSDLQAEDPNNSTGNAGLQDQRAALQWIQDNIANFGGDPTRVNIFGESAGAFSVCWHLVNPQSAGLFSRAIMESGTCDAPQFFQPVDFAISWNSIYADAVGCNVSELSLGGALGDSPLLQCLRGKSTNDMMKSLLDMFNPNWPFTGVDGEQVPVGAGPLNMTRYLTEHVGIPAALAPSTLPALAPIMPWGPAIDNSPAGLLDMPLRLIEAGKFNKVPLIIGTNKDEGTIFIPFMPLVVPGTSFPPSDADVPKIVEHALEMYPAQLVANLTASIMTKYPPTGDNWARGSAILRDYFFTCASRRAARAVLAQGVPVFLYQFSYPFSFLLGLLHDILGNFHASELFFVFDNQWPPLVVTFDGNDQEMADSFTAYWTNFAFAGNPNNGPATTPLFWPPYDVVGDYNLQLTVPVNTTRHLQGSFCDAWDNIVNSL